MTAPDQAAYVLGEVVPNRNCFKVRLACTKRHLDEVQRDGIRDRRKLGSRDNAIADEPVQGDLGSVEDGRGGHCEGCDGRRA